MPLAVCRDVLAVGTVPVSQGVGRLRPSYASLMGLGEVLCALAACRGCCWDWLWRATRAGGLRTSSQRPAGPTRSRRGAGPAG